ncbi:MAG: M24 family metallopeptidase [Candidatus Latescibacteria bacterium]|nr:M24 family metallopeptidase [Candidatus Latescibacterota bacterium]
MQGLEKIQQALGAEGIDAWLLYDFRVSNPVFWQVLQTQKKTTRRLFLLIPAQSEPELLVHAIEREAWEGSPVGLVDYSGRAHMQEWLRQALQDRRRVAMEYSPDGALPTLSWVDGGTLDLVRSYGVEVVSSAGVFQQALTTWSPTALESHLEAARHVGQIKDLAFDFIRDNLAAGQTVDECDVQDSILQAFAERGLETDHGPIVGVEAHSGDPHYEPRRPGAAQVRPGAWVLIDLWARRPGDAHIFGDITWVAHAGRQPSPQQRQVFDTVRRARDRVVDQLQRCWRVGQALEGWELDDIARQCIEEAGYGSHFTHRTGHSLGPGPAVHGLGVNLDNLETRDTRQILPGTGFTIEPGIYLPHFGVRLEINIYVDPTRGPLVTTPVQDEIISLV